MEEIIAITRAVSAYNKRHTLTSRDVELAVRILYDDTYKRSGFQAITAYLSIPPTLSGEETAEISELRSRWKDQLREAQPTGQPRVRLGNTAPVYLWAVLKELDRRGAPPTGKRTLQLSLRAGTRVPAERHQMIGTMLARVASIAATAVGRVTVRSADIRWAEEVVCPGGANRRGQSAEIGPELRSRSDDFLRAGLGRAQKPSADASQALAEAIVRVSAHENPTAAAVIGVPHEPAASVTE